MSNSGNSLTPTEEHKDKFFGWFWKSVAWQSEVDEKLAHKALDLPMTSGINVRNGVGWRELGVAGAIGLGAWHLATRQPEPPAAPPDPPAVSAPHEDRDTTRGIDIEPYVPTMDDFDRKGDSL